MQDYRVQLDVYHGPLDLLLHLIKRHEVDIHEIPVATITEQYLEYVRTLRSLDINLAGDFLVMAATLMEVKSAMIGPREEGDGEDSDDSLTSGDDPSDPRYELVQQLLAYKRFKDAAQALERRREDFAARFPRQPPPFKQDEADDQAPPELDMEDVSVWDLLEAFNNLMEQVGGPPRVEMVDDDTPIELHAEDIVDRLQRDGATTLQDMFAGRKTVGEMLGLFLATLELLRQRRVRAFQDDVAGQISLELRPESEWQANQQEDEGAAELSFDPDDPDNFEWPDEATRKRYARRIELRKRGQKVEEDEQLAQDIAELEAEEAQQTAAAGTSASTENAEE